MDALISLGGDGTMLHALQVMGQHNVPIMGINLGILGFMTNVPQNQMEEAVARLAAGDYTYSERSRIQVDVWQAGAKNCETYLALNDAALGWGTSPRIVKLEMTINEEYVTSYACDGLVISTPTGSTGHSLSAGGPILHPATRVLCISPICPHTLSSRPLVVDDSSRICVTVAGTTKDLLLAIDGQEYCTVGHGARLDLCRSAQPVRFIQFTEHGYYEVLRQKLCWRGSST